MRLNFGKKVARRPIYNLVDYAEKRGLDYKSVLSIRDYHKDFPAPVRIFKNMGREGKKFFYDITELDSYFKKIGKLQ